MNIEKSFRAFIALRISDETRSSLGLFREHLIKKGLNAKWIKSENIHLTLFFLGDIEDYRAKEIGAGLSVSLEKIEPFEYEARSAGFFPDARRPKILWAGIDKGAEEIIRLRAMAGEFLVSRGLYSDERNFVPHLTIARFKTPVLKEQSEYVVRRYKEEFFGKTKAQDLILYKSDLSPSGPAYKEVLSVPLARSQTK